MLLKPTLILLVVWLTLTISATKESSKKKEKPGVDNTLTKRTGDNDQQTPVDANTQALWEAYWKQYPENAWDVSPQTFYGGSKGRLQEHSI